MFLSVSLCLLSVSAVWAQGLNGLMRLDNLTDCSCMPDKCTVLALEKSAFLGTGSMDPFIMDVSDYECSNLVIHCQIVILGHLGTFR